MIVLQPSSYILRLVLLSFQEPAVHLVAPVQMENHHVLGNRSVGGVGGSILLRSAGKLTRLIIMRTSIQLLSSVSFCKLNTYPDT